MSDTNKAAQPPAKKSRSTLLIVGAVVLLGGGGAGAYFMTRGGAAAAEAHAEPAAETHEAPAGGVVRFEPFIVNLADAGGKRFLRADIRLLVGEIEAAEHAQEDAVTVARLRSAIIDVLTAQTAEQIVTAEGKAALKKTIAETAAPLLKSTEVSDVLFADFVIQY